MKNKIVIETFTIVVKRKQFLFFGGGNRIEHFNTNSLMKITVKILNVFH